ncbi:MAG: lysylphosphatidylglycerol synthase transmembrane domain-containing protein [Myxococcota bacterium]|nr:lysylphosphatidylglycerol synthase transmembrane domain-containing protein [Myxococcota bacterium]
MLNLKTLLKLLVVCLISVGCLWVSFKDVDFSLVWTYLEKVSYFYVGLCALGYVGIQVARVIRWKYLCDRCAPIGWWMHTQIALAGSALIVVLPLRLGEFSRPILLNRYGGTTISTGLGIAVVERVLDGLTVVFLFFFAILLLPDSVAVSDTLLFGAWASFVLFAGVGIACLLAYWKVSLFQRLLKQTFGKVSPVLANKLGELTYGFVDGLRGLDNAKTVTVVLVMTVFYWLSNALALFALFEAFGWDLPLMAAAIVTSIVVIGIMVPAGPGFLGTFQGALIGGLLLMGVEQSEAAAFTLVLYPINMTVVIGSGLPFIARFLMGVGQRTKFSGLSWSSLVEPK